MHYGKRWLEIDDPPLIHQNWVCEIHEHLNDQNLFATNYQTCGVQDFTMLDENLQRELGTCIEWWYKFENIPYMARDGKKQIYHINNTWLAFKQLYNLQTSMKNKDLRWNHDFQSMNLVNHNY